MFTLLLQYLNNPESDPTVSLHVTRSSSFLGSVAVLLCKMLGSDLAC